MRLALAARRGLWVFQVRSDGFSPDHFTFKAWEELSHPDELHRISLVMGKRAVEAAARQIKCNSSVQLQKNFEANGL